MHTEMPLRSGRFLGRASSLHPSLPGGEAFTDWSTDHRDIILHLTGPPSQIDSRAKGSEKAGPKLVPHSIPPGQSQDRPLALALDCRTGQSLCLA